MVNRGLSGMGREGYPGLVPQAEPLILKIPHHTIIEGCNTKEAQQYQKNSPLFILYIFKVPQEFMEYQRQTLKRFNQEALGYQIRGHDFN